MSERHDIQETEAEEGEIRPPAELLTWLEGDDEGGAASASGGFDAIFEAVSGDIERERGVRAWLRSRPTWMRWILAGATVPTTAALAILLKPRPDLAAYPTLRLLGLFILIGVAVGMTVNVMLRPLHQPQPSWRQVWGLTLLGGVGAPLLLMALPTNSEALMPMGYSLGVGCMIAGLIAALPMIGALWLLVRNTQRLAHRLLITAAGAGLTGNFVLEFQCPVSTPSHLLMSHVLLSCALILIAALAGIGLRGTNRS